MRFDLDVSELDEVTLVHVRRPFTSAMLHVTDAAGALPAGVSADLPAAWRSGVQRAVRSDAQTLRLLRYVVPNELLERSGTTPLSLDQHLERLHQTRDSPQLAEHLDSLYGATLPEEIRAIGERPAQFLAAATRSIDRSSFVTREFWSTVTALLDREARRIESARSAIAKLAVLMSLTPYLRFDGRWLTGPTSRGDRARPATRLELVPMLSGPGVTFSVAKDHGLDRVVESIAYPLPGLAGVVRGDGVQRLPNLLGVLLGDLRSEVLLALDIPTTMAALADRVHVSPSRITYHVDQLAAADLVRRERAGSFVWVQRTRRGDALIDTMTRE